MLLCGPRHVAVAVCFVGAYSIAWVCTVRDKGSATREASSHANQREIGTPRSKQRKEVGVKVEHVRILESVRERQGGGSRR
jgi:hypothetical protein